MDQQREGDDKDVGDGLQGDWLLAHLVQLIDNAKKGNKLGITLSVGGIIVSGQLIDGKSYFLALGRAFDGNYSKTEEDSFVIKYFASAGEIYDDEDAPPPVFIHLSDAKYIFPNSKPIPSGEGLLWRGKISSVDGFSLGYMEVSSVAS